MRRVARVILAGGIVAGLVALLRSLFEERPELLRPPQDRNRARTTRRTAPAPKRKATKRNGTAGLSREQLYEKAKRLEIQGRSQMNKRQLQRAVARREASRS